MNTARTRILDGPRASWRAFVPSRSMKPRPLGRHTRAQRVPRDPLGEVLIVRREPRIAFRVVENQMSYAYLGSRLSNSAAENFPVFLADLCAARTTHSLPHRPARCSRWMSPESVNSRTRRHFWTTPPIVCSGAGTAATARRNPTCRTVTIFPIPSPRNRQTTTQIRISNRTTEGCKASMQAFTAVQLSAELGCRRPIESRSVVALEQQNERMLLICVLFC